MQRIDQSSHLKLAGDLKHRHVTNATVPHLHRYCPGGPDSDFEYSTQSYTGYEVRTRVGSIESSFSVPADSGKHNGLLAIASQPTSMRAIRARYDPYEQSRGRVQQLRELGHSVDKVRMRATRSLRKS